MNNQGRDLCVGAMRRGTCPLYERPSAPSLCGQDRERIAGEAVEDLFVPCKDPQTCVEAQQSSVVPVARPIDWLMPLSTATRAAA